MQLCDGPLAPPATPAAIADESRFDRRFPGEGELNLPALLAALPPDIPISVETPVRAAMSPVERARHAIDATRRVLANQNYAEIV